MITLLPEFIFADMQPAFYDKESATVLELVAKMHGKTNEIVKEYNAFSKSVNERVTEFFNSNNEDFETFKIGLRQEFQDFIDVIDLKILENEQGKEELLTVKATIEKSFANFESMATETLKNQNTKLFNMEQEMLSFTTSVNNQMTNQNTKITKFIDEFEPLERGQVDYNDNDPSSTGHILNRPFWKEEYTSEVLLDTSVAFTLEYMSVNGIGTGNVKEGITYLVTWNNTEYECTAFKNGGSVLLGNGSLMTDSGISDSGEPFCMEMVTENASSIIKNTNSAETITLKVEQVGKTIYHKIDPRFIPDMYYETDEIIEVLPESSYEIDPDSGEGGFTLPSLDLVEGNFYTVNWNGVEYECECVFIDEVEEDPAMYILGNIGVLTGNPTEEPFIIISIPIAGMTQCMCLDGNTSATLSIISKGEFHKIPKKYIPNITPQTYVDMTDSSADLYLFEDIACTKKLSKADASKYYDNGMIVNLLMNGAVVGKTNPFMISLMNEYAEIILPSLNYTQYSPFNVFTSEYNG